MKLSILFCSDNFKENKIIDDSLNEVLKSKVKALEAFLIKKYKLIDQK